MKKTVLLFGLFALLFFTNMQAQDIHFSQFNLSPLTLNPAHTGAFEGSFRIGGIYRDQYRSVTSSQYSTPMFFIDAPIIALGKKKRDWLGVGLMLFQDKAGLAQFQTGSMQLSAAIHHPFDSKNKTVLTFGVQGGPVNRQIDLTSTALNFEDEVQTGGGFGPATGFDRLGMDANASYSDLAAGLLLKTSFNETTDFNIGVSVGHLLQAKTGLVPNSTYELPMRIQAHAGMTKLLTDKFSVSPTAYYTTLGPASQFQLQALGGYQFNETFKFNFGLGYRFGDAGEILLGADIKDIKVGLSYDLSLGDISQTNTGGAFEIALGYIFKIYKEPTVKPVIFCPHL